MTIFGYNATEYRRFKAYAWRYLLLFSLLYCFIYCTRLNLSNAGAVMMSAFGWTKSDFGILTGVLFWTYGIGQLVNGRLGEIVGPAKFVVLSVILSVAANVFLSFQTSIVAMAIIWGFNGYFQSMSWTPGIALLTKWWPGATRGFATGFAHAFSGFGQVAAILTVALAFRVLPDFGWRSAFILPAAFPLAMLGFYLLFSRSSPAKVGLREYVEEDPQRAKLESEMRTIVTSHGKLYPYKYVLGNRQFLVWLVIAFLTGLARYGLVTWIPLYFIDRFQVAITTGLLGSLSLPVGMGVGTLVVPWLTDRLCPNDRLPAVVSSSIVGALAISGFLLCNPTIGWQMALVQVLLFVAGFCIYAINGTAWAYATDIGGRVFSATSSGVLNFAAYMGAAAQSFVYGYLVDAIGWIAVYVSLALFCAIIAILGVTGKNSEKVRRTCQL